MLCFFFFLYVPRDPAPLSVPTLPTGSPLPPHRLPTPSPQASLKVPCGQSHFGWPIEASPCLEDSHPTEWALHRIRPVPARCSQESRSWGTKGHPSLRAQCRGSSRTFHSRICPCFPRVCPAPHQSTPVLLPTHSSQPCSMPPSHQPPPAPSRSSPSDTSQASALLLHPNSLH